MPSFSFLQSGSTPLKRLLLWGGMGAGLIVLLIVLARLGSAPVTSSPGKLSDPVRNDDWVKGNVLAKTTLVEYSDFQCPACATLYSVIKKLLSEQGTNFRLVYRHFPLAQHGQAELAAAAAEAAGKQGKFWEMHDLLFENQRSWSGSSDIAEETFIGYASRLGLNVEQFKTDLVSQAVKDKIARDKTSGISGNVDATPTFFLNGEKVTSLSSYADLERLVTAGGQ